MVSTRGPKFKFAVNERVLCFEPDPSKAKVLYDSKVGIDNGFHRGSIALNMKLYIYYNFQVIEIIEGKDKKGKRTVEYVIHFQGIC